MFIVRKFNADSHKKNVWRREERAAGHKAVKAIEREIELNIMSEKGTIKSDHFHTVGGYWLGMSHMVIKYENMP